MNKALEDFIETFANQEEVKRYNEIERILHQNELVKDKIEELKKYQKKIVIYESHNNTVPKEADDRYQKLYDELMDIPIFNEYMNLQKEINEVIQSITSLVESELNLK